MTKYQKVTSGLRGMMTWLDYELEQRPENENLLNAKAVTKDALELLKAQQICIDCLSEEEGE